MKEQSFYGISGNGWRRLILTVLLFVHTIFCVSQTTNISGVVNTYHSVIEMIPSKACVRVSSTTGLNLYNRVLLIQMKGASIVTANGSTFGDTTSLNNAGNYEVATICNIIGDSVFMFYNFLNSYTVTGKVQLVQFAQYNNALVTDTLKATAWNNSTGTGGVIAVYASGNLTLNAPVYADASGFRGGSFLLSSGTCLNSPFDATGYRYTGSNTSPQNGAYKGENVYELASNETGGRGAPANGGGGGNNHNNSGGGGANLSAGGIGGGNSSTAGCTSTLRGLGGKALSSWNGTKIYPGGGGGAGHSNGGFVTNDAGDGGGIVFLWATTIFGNGYKITANGGVGGASISDGASGGGGGGTVIMNVSNYSGVLSIEARGGNGGGSNDGGNVGRCYGGGGGGSGGVIYFSTSASVTTSIVGGNAGVEIGREASCAAAVPAGAGSNGFVINNYSFSRSYIVANYCAAPLQVQLESFHAYAVQSKVQLKWSVFDPNEIEGFEIEKRNSDDQWETILVVDANSSLEDYVAWDHNPLAGKNTYRLRIIGANGSIVYSPIAQVTFDLFVKDFNIYPNPAKKTITVTTDLNSSALMLIVDHSGRIVFSERIFQTRSTFELPALSAGVYFVRIGGKARKLFIH